MGTQESASVVLTRYGESDAQLLRVLEALSRQNADLQILVLDQRRSSKIRSFCESANASPVFFFYHEIPAHSLSYARNFGLQNAIYPIVLFLDADAIPPSEWAKEMIAGFQVESVSIVGSRILLDWERPPPMLVRSKWIKEQYDHFDLGTENFEVSKVLGCSFGLNKKLLGDQAMFNLELGLRPGSRLGGEETDLCSRARAAQHKILYIGRTQVLHQVSAARCSYSWLLRRIFSAGESRARQGGVPAAMDRRRDFFDLLLIAIIAPLYFAGYAKGAILWRKPRRD